VVKGSRKVEIKSLSGAEELSGKLKFSKLSDKLMHSVLENDKKIVEEGKVLRESINQGISSFTPNLMFEQVVNNFKMAQNIYGEKLLRWLSGYDPDYVERNIKIPEFRKDLRKRFEEGVEQLRKDKLLDKDNNITEKGIELASLSLYIEELKDLEAKGILGERIHKKASHYGDKADVKNYRKGDRYRDISVKGSIKLALRRGHKELDEKDLRVHERESKGQIEVIYALDSSGSMKGKKIDMAKKAGVALAFKAIDKKDKVGLIVFGSEIKEEIAPSLDFSKLLKKISMIRTSKQTDFVKMLEKAVELFSSLDNTKHLILLSDALPTVGEKPEEETLEAVSVARSRGITISLIGIQLDKKGEELAKKIVELGEGRLYIVKNLEEMDEIVLEDYYSIF
jgi:magnesium chelatase subunit I